MQHPDIAFYIFGAVPHFSSSYDDKSILRVNVIEKLKPYRRNKNPDFSGCKNAPENFVTILYSGNEISDFRGQRFCIPLQ